MFPCDTTKWQPRPSRRSFFSLENNDNFFLRSSPLDPLPRSGGCFFALEELERAEAIQIIPLVPTYEYHFYFYSRYKSGQLFPFICLPCYANSSIVTAGVRTYVRTYILSLIHI